MGINVIAGLYVIFRVVWTLFRTERFVKLYGRDTVLIKSFSHKQERLYKDMIECSKLHLFMFEKAYYTYSNAVIRQAR